MSNYILMVFEGEKTEKTIFDNIKRYYLNENPDTIVYGFHCGEIYSLFNKLYKDEDLELFTLLKEQLSTKNNELADIKKSEVHQIYLFFDYDGHAASADETKLELMFELFNDETENGKLYISYPMAEALQHLNSEVKFEEVIATSEPAYKSIVKSSCDECYLHISSLLEENWDVIIKEHCKKLSFIVNDLFIFPERYIDQLEIFTNQQDKYITPSQKVSVLSAFPIFLADYYGYSKFKD